jgi:small GTP-binding protein
MEGGAQRTRIDLKVIVMGHGGVGKTSLVRRYITDEFSDTVSTIGASFVLKRWRAFYLGIWDTAGQGRFTRISAYYCRGAQAAVLVFDLGDRESFLALDNYARLLDDASPGCMVVVVGTKADLLAADGPRPVPREEAEAYAAQRRAPYYETSAKDNVNVSAVFEHIALSCLAGKLAMAAESEGGGGAAVDPTAGAAPSRPEPVPIEDAASPACKCAIM